jgi:hypothetical protein
MKHGQKAWLLTWDWMGEHAAVEDRIAAILRPRLSRLIVGEIVEYLYAIHSYSPTELAAWSRRPKENPYKVQWGPGHCYCGQNPFLSAHYVHDLIITKDSDTGLETISWVLPALNQYNDAGGKIEQVRGEIPQSVKRTIVGPLSRLRSIAKVNN